MNLCIQLSIYLSFYTHTHTHSHTRIHTYTHIGKGFSNEDGSASRVYRILAVDKDIGEILQSPHRVGLFYPYSRSLLTLVWSTQARFSKAGGSSLERTEEGSPEGAGLSRSLSSVV